MQLRQTAEIVWNRAFLKTLFDTFVDEEAAGGGLSGLKAKFFTNQVDVTPDSVLADYSDNLAALGTAGTDVEFAVVTVGNGLGVKAQVEVIAGMAPDNETIEGILILNTAMDTVVGGRRFDTPVAIVHEGDGVSVDVIGGVSYRWESGESD